MTVVIADTSPLNYLVLIQAVELLPRLYERIIIPEAVLGELRDFGSPKVVRDWAFQLTDWIEVQPAPPYLDSDLRALDPGERAAIAIAESQSDALLLMDDAAGRDEATLRGIPSVGTLGVLRAAAIRGYIDLPETLKKLLATNFRVAATLIDQLIEEELVRRS